MKNFFLIIILLLISMNITADIPDKDEQIVYSILCFDSRQFSETFCSENSDTIYLLADVDNFITARKTLIYFWPLTNTNKMDLSNLNIILDGIIEISGDNIETKHLEQMRYTYYNAPGDYEFDWRVYKGEEADREFIKYMEVVDEYYKELYIYQYTKAIYDQVLQDVTVEASRRREAGEDVEDLLEKLQNLEIPAEPLAPQYYVGPVEKAFIFNLPEGEYNIRFLTEDGYTIEGSEKKLVVFNARRKQRVGYDIIAGDKWTKPKDSKTPSSVLYTDGSANIFLRPFYQNEFNNLYYNRMKVNQSQGNPNIMAWEKVQQVPNSQIELSYKNNKNTIINEEAFYVEQAADSPGYAIVPFTDELMEKGYHPSFKAFHIPINPGIQYVNYRLLDSDGNYITGSERQIRIVVKPEILYKMILWFLIILPHILMSVVLILRSKKYSV